jgi:hypothetical protein
MAMFTYSLFTYSQIKETLDLALHISPVSPSGFILKGNAAVTWVTLPTNVECRVCSFLVAHIFPIPILQIYLAKHALHNFKISIEILGGLT